MGMTTNWLKPLDEIVTMVTLWFTERGYVLTEDSGRALASQFYQGRNRAYAAKKIQAAVEKSVATAQYQKWCAKTKLFREMEETLIAEGWHWCNDISIPDAGVWEHTNLRLSVNRGGGTFPSREEGTYAAFHSQLRKTINGDESPASQKSEMEI